MPTIQIEKREGKVKTRTGRDGLIIEQEWHYRILADNLNQDRTTILHGTSGVPTYGTAYGPYNLFLQSADGDRLEDYPLFWDCTYILANKFDEGEDTAPDGTQQTGDPTAWVPWFEVGFEDYDEVVHHGLPFDAAERHTRLLNGVDPKGYSNYDWANSALRPFEDGLVRQRRIITRDFTQFYPLTGPNVVTLDDIEEHNDLLNDRQYLGKEPKTLLLQLRKAAVGVWYGKRCIRADYTMSFKAEDWRLKKRDTGWDYLTRVTAPFEWAPFGKDEPRLGPLNGLGQPVAARNPTDPLGSAAILYFKEFRSDNFAAFLKLQ